MYERTEIMFYANHIGIYIKQDFEKQVYIPHIKSDIENASAGGGTDFMNCFDHIKYAL